jgi:hypothetical protein
VTETISNGYILKQYKWTKKFFFQLANIIVLSYFWFCNLLVKIKAYIRDIFSFWKCLHDFVGKLFSKIIQLLFWATSYSDKCEMTGKKSFEIWFWRKSQVRQTQKCINLFSGFHISLFPPIISRSAFSKHFALNTVA